MSEHTPGQAPVPDADDARLASLGYQPQLRRVLGFFFMKSSAQRWPVATHTARRAASAGQTTHGSSALATTSGTPASPCR